MQSVKFYQITIHMLFGEASPSELTSITPEEDWTKCDPQILKTANFFFFFSSSIHHIKFSDWLFVWKSSFVEAFDWIKNQYFSLCNLLILEKEKKKKLLFIRPLSRFVPISYSVTYSKFYSYSYFSAIYVTLSHFFLIVQRLILEMHVTPILQSGHRFFSVTQIIRLSIIVSCYL